MACRVGKMKTGILKTGKLNKTLSNPKRSNPKLPGAGFTMIELIVVLVIISIMLVFAVPKLSYQMFRDDMETTLNWIVFNVSKYKIQARNEGTQYLMCLSSDTNLIEIKENSKKNLEDNSADNLAEGNVIARLQLPESISIDDVEFNRPGKDKDLTNDSCILFYKKGYSDQAVIHISDDSGNFFSCMIQPFLQKTKIYEGVIRFE